MNTPVENEPTDEPFYPLCRQSSLISIIVSKENCFLENINKKFTFWDDFLDYHPKTMSLAE